MIDYILFMFFLFYYFMLDAVGSVFLPGFGMLGCVGTGKSDYFFPGIIRNSCWNGLSPSYLRCFQANTTAHIGVAVNMKLLEENYEISKFLF